MREIWLRSENRAGAKIKVLHVRRDILNTYNTYMYFCIHYLMVYDVSSYKAGIFFQDVLSVLFVGKNCPKFLAFVIVMNMKLNVLFCASQTRVTKLT